jgi:SAM-dependent methyltransferase
VSEYYGSVLGRSEDLATNACCAAGAPPGYLRPLLARIDDGVTARFYGCGFPIPEAVQGRVVLDLGCGTGRDVYLLSQLVGREGFVIGLDMTEPQLEVARSTLDLHTERFGLEKPNVEFRRGYIEDLAGAGVGDASVDLVISNCVVNLSPRKDLVLDEIRRVLRPGGEFHFSDVVVDRRLPEEIAFDPVLHAECLGGAMYDADFLALARTSGFGDPREVSRSAITVQNPEVEAKVAPARFSAVTYRLLKLAGLDDRCEDYGQVASYRGGILGAERLFRLDDHHLFEAGRPERVCGNTAAMLTQTRLAPFFEVRGGRDTHFGAFPCNPTIAHDRHPTRCC